MNWKAFFRSAAGNKADDGSPKVDRQEAINELGRFGEQVSELHVSILNMNRLLIFLSQCSVKWWRPETRSRPQTVMRVVKSLTKDAAFLANRVNFMLNAVLVMINIEQNAIIKTFLVAAVVLMPRR